MANLIIENYKCVICGRIKQDIEKQDPRPLCPWCANLMLKDFLEGFIEELDNEIQSIDFIDCNRNPLFAFVADLGTFACEHLYFETFRTLLGRLTSIANQINVHVSKIKGTIKSTKVYSLLTLMRDLNLLRFGDGENDQPSFQVVHIEPGSLIHKIATTIEADTELPRVSTFLLGFVVLKAIVLTLNLIEQNGHLQRRQGITRLYPIRKDGALQVPKNSLNPLIFIFGTWANGVDEFTSQRIHEFLDLRNLKGKARERIIDVFVHIHPGSIHQITSHEMTEEGIYKFTINPMYSQLRERVRSRVRERTRG